MIERPGFWRERERERNQLFTFHRLHVLEEVGRLDGDVVSDVACSGDRLGQIFQDKFSLDAWQLAANGFKEVAVPAADVNDGHLVRGAVGQLPLEGEAGEEVRPGVFGPRQDGAGHGLVESAQRARIRVRRQPLEVRLLRVVDELEDGRVVWIVVRIRETVLLEIFGELTQLADALGSSADVSTTIPDGAT